MKFLGITKLKCPCAVSLPSPASAACTRLPGPRWWVWPSVELCQRGWPLPPDCSEESELPVPCSVVGSVWRCRKACRSSSWVPLRRKNPWHHQSPERSAQRLRLGSWTGVSPTLENCPPAGKATMWLQQLPLEYVTVDYWLLQYAKSFLGCNDCKIFAKFN